MKSSNLLPHRKFKWYHIFTKIWWMFVGVNFTVLYVGITSTVLEHQESFSEQNVVLFGSFSIGVRTLLQLVVNYKLSLTKIATFQQAVFITSCFTIYIDTQIRMAISQLGETESIIGGTVLLSIGEIMCRSISLVFFRFRLNEAKERVRKKMLHIDNYTAFKERMLLIKAAETYADMIAEYVAINTTFLVSSYVGGEMFYKREKTSFSVDIGLILLQYVVEIFTDVMSTAFELGHGLPLTKYWKEKHCISASTFLFIAFGFCNTALLILVFVHDHSHSHEH